MGLAAPVLTGTSDRHTQPQEKGSRLDVCRGGTYATSATFRPPVGGVVLRLSDAKRTDKVDFALRHWSHPAIRSKDQPTAGNNTAERRMHARGGSLLFIKARPAGRPSLPSPSAVLVTQLKAGSAMQNVLCCSPR